MLRRELYFCSIFPVARCTGDLPQNVVAAEPKAVLSIVISCDMEGSPGIGGCHLR